MTPRPRRPAAAASPALRGYLETGQYLSDPVDFDVYLLAGHVMRNNIAGLVAAWTAHGPEILARWPYRRKRPWAETRLGAVATRNESNGAR